MISKTALCLLFIWRILSVLAEKTPLGTITIDTQVYVPESEVLPVLKINMSDLITADPLRVWFPDTPPGELANDKLIGVLLPNLSTTPASLQVMLKLSPAVGTPGIMISGVNRLLLSAKWHEITYYI